MILITESRQIRVAYFTICQNSIHKIDSGVNLQIFSFEFPILNYDSVLETASRKNYPAA